MIELTNSSGSLRRWYIGTITESKYIGVFVVLESEFVYGQVTARVVKAGVTL
jgi:hypothetical protein